MTIWFTSDLHFFHKNIITFSNRPFKDVDEMNEALVTNWNDRVASGDVVYLLGDVSFAGKDRTNDVLYRLKGTMHLVRGNHDKKLSTDRFASVNDLLEISPNGHPIVLCHFPMVSWNKSHHGSWHLHGHTHGSYEPPEHKRMLDVGVDVHGYKPISLETVTEYMSTRPWFAPPRGEGRKDK